MSTNFAPFLAFSLDAPVGDLIGAHTLRTAIALGLPLHLIHGNNLGDPVALHNLSRQSGGLLAMRFEVFSIAA